MRILLQVILLAALAVVWVHSAEPIRTRKQIPFIIKKKSLILIRTFLKTVLVYETNNVDAERAYRAVQNYLERTKIDGLSLAANSSRVALDSTQKFLTVDDGKISYLKCNTCNCKSVIYCKLSVHRLRQLYHGWNSSSIGAGFDLDRTVIRGYEGFHQKSGSAYHQWIFWRRR